MYISLRHQLEETVLAEPPAPVDELVTSSCPLWTPTATPPPPEPHSDRFLTGGYLAGSSMEQHVVTLLPAHRTTQILTPLLHGTVHFARGFTPALPDVAVSLWLKAPLDVSALCSSAGDVRLVCNS
jgi:hypothetical protein